MGNIEGYPLRKIDFSVCRLAIARPMQNCHLERLLLYKRLQSNQAKRSRR